MTVIKPTITDEAIEQAARALWGEPGWEQASPEQRRHHREAAERVVLSVAPLIAAQALRDAADELRRLDDGRTGGYYDAGRHIIRRLDARADEIEAGRCCAHAKCPGGSLCCCIEEAGR